MKKAFVIVCMAAGLAHIAFAQRVCPATPQDQTSQQASAYLRGALADRASANTDPVTRSGVLAAFYQPCHFALAWTKDGELTRAAKLVIAELQVSGANGLRPTDYGGDRWGGRACALDIQCDDTPITIAKFDMDLTIALTRYLLDLSYGRIDPRALRANFATHPDINLISDYIWTQIVAGNDVHHAIEQLEPWADGYVRTKKALHSYQALEQQPDVILPHYRKVLAVGDAGDDLPPLAARLQQLGDLAPDQDCTTIRVYSAEIAAAVKHFQSRHGLEPTGRLDPATYRELAIPIKQRTVQLTLTLERWRWVAHSFAVPPIVINIPEYRLRAYSADLKPVLSMPIIVGGAFHRKTPVFQGEVGEVVFRPYWNVPYDIQQREIVPKLQKNPGYLRRNAFEVVDQRGVAVSVSNPQSLLSELRDHKLRIRQIPGDQNSLGLIKFVFPNDYGVYMHGTPAPLLFEKDRRDLSHGCIRVKDPVALALWVLRAEKGWDTPKIEERIAPTAKSSSVKLQEPVPILIVYGTAVAEENGEVHFFRDIYGYDAPLIQALNTVSTQRQKAANQAW
jgi:murein L,D-transpeptidase YcbB/YkuD